jgi:hypothetical protein
LRVAQDRLPDRQPGDATEVGGDFGSLRDELRTNIPPELRVEGEKTRQVKVGAPVPLVAFAGDPDNLPARRDGKPQPRHASGRMEGESPSAPAHAAPARPATPTNLANLIYRRPRRSCRRAGPACASWVVIAESRGRAAFTPDQMKTWTDTRYANSPWSPPYAIPLPPADGKWVAQATFAEPGTYILRAVASDGSVFTYDNVTVTVPARVL